jgi:membrane peptidoglycan carboxypeptidase
MLDLSGCRLLDEDPAYRPEVLRASRPHRFADGTTRQLGPGSPGWVALDGLPLHVSRAFVAAEDAKFFTHAGFDPEQIGRSAWVNLSEGRVARGGSTITQQLVKNVFLSRQRTLARKIDEAILTWRAEASLSKAEILAYYLNIVEFAPGVWGLAEGARHWFGLPPERLSVAQAAFLAALTPEPTSMSERLHKAGGLDEKSRARWLAVIAALERERVVNHAVADRARRETLRFAPLSRRPAAGK